MLEAVWRGCVFAYLADEANERMQRHNIIYLFSYLLLGGIIYSVLRFLQEELQSVAEERDVWDALLPPQ